MSKQLTQFAIALTLSIGLAAATLSAVVAEVFFDGQSELTLALVTGLVAANGQAVAFLFRTNNSTKTQ
jgi:hypothetical protein